MLAPQLKSSHPTEIARGQTAYEAARMAYMQALYSTFAATRTASERLLNSGQRDLRATTGNLQSGAFTFYGQRYQIGCCCARCVAKSSILYGNCYTSTCMRSEPSSVCTLRQCKF